MTWLHVVHRGVLSGLGLSPSPESCLLAERQVPCRRGRARSCERVDTGSCVDAGMGTWTEIGAWGMLSSAFGVSGERATSGQTGLCLLVSLSQAPPGRPPPPTPPCQSPAAEPARFLLPSAGRGQGSREAPSRPGSGSLQSAGVLCVPCSGAVCKQLQAGSSRGLLAGCCVLMGNEQCILARCLTQLGSGAWKWETAPFSLQ